MGFATSICSDLPFQLYHVLALHNTKWSLTRQKHLGKCTDHFMRNVYKVYIEF
uniref:Uncharacterized protein n=1 Tax=Rhizophora mucronata TaxID=61149 RepID=A0A2P2NMS7_RHIMU